MVAELGSTETSTMTMLMEPEKLPVSEPLAGVSGEWGNEGTASFELEISDLALAPIRSPITVELEIGDEPIRTDRKSRSCN